MAIINSSACDRCSDAMRFCRVLVGLISTWLLAYSFSLAQPTASTASRKLESMKVGHYYLLRVGQTPMVMQVLDFKGNQLSVHGPNDQDMIYDTSKETQREMARPDLTVSFRLISPGSGKWSESINLSGHYGYQRIVSAKGWHMPDSQVLLSHYSVGLKKSVATESDLVLLGLAADKPGFAIAGDETNTYPLGPDEPAAITPFESDGFTTNAIMALNAVLSLNTAGNLERISRLANSSNLVGTSGTGITVLPKQASNMASFVFQNLVKLMLSCGAFVIAFGMSSFFMRDIFPWKKENPKLSNILSFSAAFFLSAVFGVWLFTAQAAQQFIDQITKGFAGVLTKVIAALFAAIFAYLFWRKIKGFFKIGS